MRKSKPRFHGVLVIDKPAGVTSHDVVQRVRRIANQSRVGHGGTLDPLATGVLPTLLGSTTRLLRYLSNDPKIYRTTARLGFETTTGDSDGEMIGTASEFRPDRESIERAVAQLSTIKQQIPPMYSAKKIGGKRLHELARAGEEIERAPIPIVIHRLDLLTFTESEVELEVTCSPGTFVRSLVIELGQILGTGAHVSRLRRIASGLHRIGSAVTLNVLESGEKFAAASDSTGPHGTES